MSTEPKRKRRVGRTLGVVRAGLRGLYRSQLPRMAAALSYRTIFSLIPTLVIGLVVLDAFATDEDVERLLTDFLHYTGISELVVPSGEPAGAGPEAGAATAGTREDVGGGAQPAGEQASDASERLDAWIRGLVIKVRSIPLTAIGVMGVLLLIYAALSMLVEIERAFNTVYHAPSGRGWIRRLTQYWTMLTLGSVLLAATFFVGEWFKGRVSELVQTGSSGGVPVVLIGFVTTVAISTLLLVVMYTTVPHTRVHLRPALAGAIVAAIAWEIGKWGFTQYLGYAASYARLYGSIALIPVFMLWVYVTWLIVLFGLQVSYGLQVFSTWRAGEDAGEETPTIIDPAFVLSIMVAVANRFVRGDHADAGTVASDVNVDERAALEMLEQLTERNLLCHVAEGEETRYTLARAPESIDAGEVLSVGDSLAGPAQALVTELRRARAEALRGKTLASILAQSGDAGPADAAAGSNRPAPATGVDNPQTPAPPPDSARPTRIEENEAGGSDGH